MPIVKLMCRWVPALVVVFFAAAGVAAAASAAEGTVCSIPQSPRTLHHTSAGPFFLSANNSMVSEATADSLVYSPRLGGPPQTLLRCGQHYHFPIENPQGCGGKGAAAVADGASSGAAARPGDWVEIHTVYAAKVKPGNCDPETLCCCEEGPFMVRAFAARVTAGGSGGPIVPPGGRPLAEWSGSTTGDEYPAACPSGVPASAAGVPAAAAEDPNPACKPAALWSFRLGCEFRVSEAQLRDFHHVDPARPVQPANRLSRDLTRVGAARSKG